MTTNEVLNFMGYRKITALASTALILMSVVSLSVKHLEFGLDFTGGTLIEVGYSNAADLSQVRASLAEAGYSNAIVVHFGSDKEVLIRLQAGYSDTMGSQIIELLQRDITSTISLRRIEFVGPQVGDELKEQGGLALLAALLMVMFYVAFRFQFKFAIGAVIAVAHDVIITLGLFSLFQWEFDLTVLAALLAVIGYSLNDTIVVSDRIRENFRKIRKSKPIDIINISLTQTLGRTLVTSFTTLLVLSALFLFGGELIRGFALALMIGVAVGTYSSIYVAANMLIILKLSKEDLIVPAKEGKENDDGRP